MGNQGCPQGSGAAALLKCFCNCDRCPAFPNLVPSKYIVHISEQFSWGGRMLGQGLELCVDCLEVRFVEFNGHYLIFKAQL